MPASSVNIQKEGLVQLANRDFATRKFGDGTTIWIGTCRSSNRGFLKSNLKSNLIRSCIHLLFKTGCSRDAYVCTEYTTIPIRHHHHLDLTSLDPISNAAVYLDPIFICRN
ncbi:hypothetical protein EYC84_003660 [Monilinia fructicola]|uniref:Uncharacterized protein n=1 Tax=Monilinia fructicola TaxID=38448 RepID=A0A5M9K2L2_MONFR|nr:hypothetical protein EYC84_003660 [Monilinia fructicola]